MGRQLKPESSLPVELDADEVVTVDNFTYIVSNITSNGEIA